jgi:hypothetical protein
MSGVGYHRLDSDLSEVRQASRIFWTDVCDRMTKSTFFRYSDVLLKVCKSFHAAGTDVAEYLRTPMVPGDADPSQVQSDRR